MRKSNWEKALNAEIERTRELEFSWDKNHCLGFAARCQEAMTGKTDFPEAFTSTSFMSAQKIIKKHGGDLTSWMDEKLQRINLLAAQRGDFIEVETDIGEAIGVCIGEKVAVMGEDGLEFMPMTHGIRAWKV